MPRRDRVLTTSAARRPWRIAAERPDLLRIPGGSGSAVIVVLGSFCRPSGARPAADGGQRTEVGELVGIDDGPDGLDSAIGDVEADHVDQSALWVEELGSRMAVDHDQFGLGAQPLSLPEPGFEHPGNVVAAVDRAVYAGALGPAVAVEDGVIGEQSNEPVHVASLAGGEELFGKPVALLARGLEAGLVIVDAPAGAAGQLTAAGLGSAQHGADLAIVIAEDVMQQERRPLRRRQGFEDDQESHRERVRTFHCGGDVMRTVIDQWFG